MPRIPLYNEGAGPTIRVAAGRISPRASAEAFTAPGRATMGYQRVLSGISDVATEFELAEQKVEQERVEREQLATILPQADEMITNPKAKTVRGFDIEAGAFKNNALQTIDALEGLNSRQKNSIKFNVNKALDRKITIGRASVWTKQTEERSKVANEGIKALLPDASNKQMRNSVLADIELIITSGQEDGLKLNYDMPSIRYEIAKQDAVADSLNENLTLSQLEEKKRAELLGEGEAAEREVSQRQQIANIYQNRINDLKYGAVAKTRESAKDVIAQVNATGNDDGARNVYQQMIDLGMDEEANEFSQNVLVNRTMYSFKNEIALAPATTASAALAEINKLPIEGDVADENAAIRSEAAKVYFGRQAALEEDSANYISQVLASKGEEVTPARVVSYQRTMGLPLKPFTNDQIISIQGQLNEASEIQYVGIIQSTLQSALDAGLTQNQFLSEMQSYGFSFEDMVIASNLGDSTNFDRIASIKVDPSEVKGRLEEGIYEEIITFVAEELRPYEEALIRGGKQAVESRRVSSQAGNHILALEQMVRDHAAYLVSFKKITPKVAAEEATRFINDRFVFPTVNKETFLLPREYSNIQPQIEQELTRILNDPSTLKDAYIGPFVGDETGEASRQQFAKEVRESGRWATKPDNSGVQLLDSTDNTVVRNDGSYIEYDFSSLAVGAEESVNRQLQIKEINKKILDLRAKAVESTDKAIIKDFYDQVEMLEMQKELIESQVK
jgi:hypothetical protein